MFKNQNQKISVNIIVKGLIQGVGFRPFIYRLALKHQILGWVKNTTENLIIHAQGGPGSIHSFIEDIRYQAPKAANIIDINQQYSENLNCSDFSILPSEDISDSITEISPDIAVCDECLSDMKLQGHRINYPFINCTNCGPRFSIIQDLPYDRERTTMNKFRMCEICRNEYTDIFNRRFHAQPVACNNCGPEYKLLLTNNTISDVKQILKQTALLIEQGKIIAIKGLGGFHLACDATNEDAVKRLRASKLREGKPFAVMFKDIDKVKNYCFLSEEEEQSLTSWKKPIIILKNINVLAKNVSMGFNTTGAMLPYMPFHYLLFEELNNPAIVLTSGNISEEPIMINNETAKEKLKIIYDAILLYNRDIYNRTDDSVCHLVNKSERILRRSRGYAPVPVKMNTNVDGIIAAGAELVNCFCIGKENQAILSQHIGDLKNYETYEFYIQSIEQYKKLFRLKPTLIACDMHPDYLSTRYAKETGLPLVEIQHHYAHIASCMAENGLDEKVIGISFDGTGYGDDGNIWGGEFFICDLLDYKRYSHFEYIPLPGGDAVTKEPWRSGLSYLFSVFGDELFEFDIPFIKNLNKEKARMLIMAINNNINSPLSSSAGRLFDAVAAILNICFVTQFHAEAPMRLEDIIEPNIFTEYGYEIDNIVSFKRTISEIITDIQLNIPVEVISARFHNTIISVIFAMVKKMFEETGIKKIVLSGGTFQNKYISENIENKLINNGFDVFVQKSVPANDGGIALGQLAIAAKRRELKCV